MTRHRYDAAGIRADYARAAFGLVITLGPVLLLEPAPAHGEGAWAAMVRAGGSLRENRLLGSMLPTALTQRRSQAGGSVPKRVCSSIQLAIAVTSRTVVDPDDLQHFLDSFLYAEEAVLLDEIRAVDPESRRIEALLDAGRPLPFAAAQRVSASHPAHVSGAEFVMTTGSLGCLHAWLFHGVRWDEGWAGFGNRIHRADFKRLARRDAPVDLVSTETKTRVGPTRIVIRFAFEFSQAGELVYVGDQSAMFVKGRPLE